MRRLVVLLDRANEAEEFSGDVLGSIQEVLGGLVRRHGAGFLEELEVQLSFVGGRQAPVKKVQVERFVFSKGESLDDAGRDSLGRATDLRALFERFELGQRERHPMNPDREVI